MGRLKDLWQELKSVDKTNPRRKEIQEEINKIEEWMISQGLRKDITLFYESLPKSPNYPQNTGFIWYEDFDKI